MLIIVTGTPGTGKSSTSALLGKRMGIRVLHLREFVKEKKLVKERDREMDSDVVNLNKLKKELKKEIDKSKGDLIIEGHVACEIALDAKYVFVLRCEPKELKKRLQKRKYSDRKIKENMLCEMLDYCLQKSEENFPKARIFQIETAHMSVDFTAKKMENVLYGKKIKKENINYADELKKYLGLSERKKDE